MLIYGLLFTISLLSFTLAKLLVIHIESQVDAKFNEYKKQRLYVAQRLCEQDQDEYVIEEY